MEKKLKMHRLTRNRTLGSLIFQLRHVLKERLIVKESGAMKERPPALHWNNRKGAIRKRLYPAKTPT